MTRPATLVSTLALVVVSLAAGPVQPASATHPVGGGTRTIAPGTIGKATVGMSVAKAVATGQLNQDVENPPCDPIALQPKRPYKNQYVVLVVDGRIVEMDAVGSRVRTPEGIRVDSTYRRVKRTYGAALSAPSEVGYGQWGAFVSTGKRGAGRAWIGFLFGNAFVDEAPLRGSDTVTLMGVTKGKRPPLALDGC